MVAYVEEKCLASRDVDLMAPIEGARAIKETRILLVVGNASDASGKANTLRFQAGNGSSSDHKAFCLIILKAQA